MNADETVPERRTGGRRSARAWREDAAWAAGLFLFAALVRTVTALRTDVIFNDGPIFLGIVERMRDGRIGEALAQDQHPGYPALVWAASGWLGDPADAAVVVSIVFGSAAVVALYAFLLQAWGRRVAVIGAFLLAIHAYAARYSADVQSEPVYLFFFLAAIAGLYGALRRGAPWPAAVAGGLAGLAYLTRPEGIGVVLVGASLAGVAWLRGSWPAGRTLRFGAALAGGAALFAVPYLAVVRAVSGSLRLSQKKSVLAILGLESTDLAAGGSGAAGLLPDASDGLEGLALELLVAAVAGIALSLGLARLRGTAVVRVRVGGIALGAAIAAAAVAAAVAAPAAFGFFAGVVASTLRPEVIALAAVGISAGASREPSGRTLFVTFVVGLYMVVLFGLLLAYGYLSRRHALPPLALLLGYAAAGAVALIDGLAARLASRVRTPGRARATAAAVVVAVLLVIALPKTWDAHRREERPARLAAEWLRGQAAGTGGLASSRLKHGWYADRAWMPLRDPGGVRPLASLSAHGVRWVLAERDVPPAELRAVVARRDEAGFALVERHAVTEAGLTAVVFEIVRAPASGRPGP